MLMHVLCILVQVRLPSKSDKPGSFKGPELDIAKKSVRMELCIVLYFHH